MQTTCEIGGDLILPATPPAKYGYTFKGWNAGDLVLRAIKRDTDVIADSYDITTRKITRRVGIKVLDGTEIWLI